MKKMIDIHNHLIPEFDDGPKTFEESLEMLRIARDQGITDVFATSHFNEYIPSEMEKEYFSKLDKLRDEILFHSIDINVYSGSEIFYHHYAADTVKKSEVTTLGGFGQYVLIEFPMFQMPEGVEQVLFDLSVAGYIPIVAHPERYNALLTNDKKVYDFIKYGGLLQVNGGSILGHFGKEVQKVGMNLLEKRLVHFIASDAHTTQNRTFILRKVYEFLKDKLPEHYLEELLYKNSKCIIDEVKLDKIQLPDPGEPRSLFDRLFKRKR